MKLIRSLNGDILPVVKLSDANSQNVDGTSASAATANAIDSTKDSLVRIVAVSALIYVAFGTSPTAEAGDIAIPAGGELWTTITAGHKIAVLGGIANITKVP